MGRWNGPAAAAAAAAALLLSVQASFAWGPEGHRAIALIADDRLQKSAPEVRAKIQALLAADKGDRLTKSDIASAATWADVLREKSPEARTATTAWHFTRLKAESPDVSRDCFGHKPLPAGYPASHGPWDNCSIDKVKQFEAELRDPKTTRQERLAALKFLLNLVGDLNDPLDAIDHGDRGGACVALQVGGHAPVRLSTYWEDTLVREVVGSEPARGAARLAAAIPAADAQKWAEGTPEGWAREAYQVAKEVAYSFGAEKPAGSYAFPLPKGEKEACPSIALYKVGVDYETKALLAVKTQLAKGGVRLARILRDGLK